MSKIKIGARVTTKARPTKVTVSGTFQGYELEDQEDPTSICGKVFYVKDGKQYLAHVYIDSIEVCDSEDEKIRQYLIQMVNAIRADEFELSGLNKEEVFAYLALYPHSHPSRGVTTLKIPAISRCRIVMWTFGEL